MGKESTMVRRIMHVDMDAFYASVEQVDNPHLKGKPVIIGASRRGVVSAASYEARKYGIHSAMPVFKARKLCPHGIFLPGRKERYREKSREIMVILERISPLVEQVSIDEAFVDISGTEALHGPPGDLGEKLKARILESTHLTCSIGIAPNKFLAKIASDMKKPDGLTIIEEEHMHTLLSQLPISKIPGIGTKTSTLLDRLGVRSPADILRRPQTFWMEKLGKTGSCLYRMAQGIDHSEVTPYAAIKSCSAEDTFPEDTQDLHLIKKWLFHQAEAVARDLRHKGLKGKTISIKVKYRDFKVATRSLTLPGATNCTQTIFQGACRLLQKLHKAQKIRLVGVGVSNIQRGPQQMSLFPNPEALRSERLDSAVDKIREKYGDRMITTGLVMDLDR